MRSHRDAWLHTQKHFYTHKDRHTSTQRWFYTEQLYTQVPLQTEVLWQRNGFTRGAFMYWCFYTGILLHDFRRRARISRYKSSVSRCKTAISPQLVATKTHFVREGCVSWILNPRRPAALRESLENFWTSRCLYSKKFNICHFNISTLWCFLGSWSPPAPMYLPQYNSICSCGSCVKENTCIYVTAPKRQ